ncbi:PAS domain S-box protein [Phyllobacterium sp. 0TCS1.6C]|nr:PAS domain S-box protein [Phyllobacterium sp. 0TCS1.6C]MCX8295772.1 PAS domain S-box protein [Phyllobacterium sp. 0TCS1.6A]
MEYRNDVGSGVPDPRQGSSEALRRSEEQFRILVQGVTDYAIYMLDTSGHVSSWNIGAERIKGYKQHEIIGQHFSRFYTEEDLNEGLPDIALATAFRTGRYEKEGWRVRKDGTRFWANVIIDAVRNDDGELIGFAKVTRDVTERMNAQKELAKAREALFQSQKMEAIGQLTGGVAHDFNNLLMAVLGSLELLRKRISADPRALDLLDNAVEAAQRGSSLTQRMLAFARRQDLDLQTVDLPGLVDNVADLLERSIGPAITIDMRFPAQLPNVTADPNQLELALLNLAVNARDAMPNGGKIVISAREATVAGGDPDMAAGRYACLSISDEGEGMDKETLDRAIEPFYTTKGVGKGTGLGLPMVHGIMKQSGGQLVLRSEPQKGTTAELWLPVAQEQEITAPVRAMEVQATPEKRALKVLAVDDDALVLMNTVAMLEELGHEVIEASSGRDALGLLEQNPDIDLVVTDQAMPRMTGTQLLGHIKERSPSLPVILVTGYSELPKDFSKVPLLSKPFMLSQLSKKLAEALSSAAAAPDEDAAEAPAS